MEKNPKVFISYSHDDIEFSNLVLEFSNKLRNEGIDTILDQYEESPAEGWPRWMENAVEKSDYVLSIASKGYLSKTKSLEKHDIGRGVKWEVNIIYNLLYNNGSLNTKFIPVVFTENDLEFIPIPLQGATHYDVSNTNRYESLYLRLRGIKKVEKPKLGKLKPLPFKERKTLFLSTPIDLEKWNNAGWKGTGFFLDIRGIEVPYFALLFTNEEYSKKIFKEWQELYGKNDVNNEIRIAVIEGDIPGKEKGYTIHITPNYKQVTKRMINKGLDLQNNLIGGISRIQRSVTRDNFKMFNLFKKQFYQFEKCYLIPAYYNEQEGTCVPFYEYRILKSNIEFRQVKEIDEQDIDYPTVK